MNSPAKQTISQSEKQPSTAKDAAQETARSAIFLQPRLARSLNAFLWPIAVVIILHRTWILPQNLDSTDDFTTVWKAVNRFTSGLPVYTENYLTVDPHYLYSPGGTLLLTPISLLGSMDTGRIWFAVAQSASILVAVVLLLLWYGVPRRSPLIPAIIALCFLSEPVTNTIDFTNVNGGLFLALVVFLMALHQRRSAFAGIVLGLCITIKPVFLPLLFLPFMRRQFSSIFYALGVVIAANAVAWPLMERPRDYLDITIPYLGEVREYANSSLTGQLVWLGANPTLILMWRIFFGIFVLISLVLLLRWLERDEKFWLATTSGILFTGAFFLSSLGQQYYSLMLLPMVLTIIRPLIGMRDDEGAEAKTIMLNWSTGLATILCFFYAYWIIEPRDVFTNWLNIAIGGIGWGVYILAIAALMIRMTIVDSVNGRDFASGFSWLNKWKLAGKNSHNEIKEASQNV